MTQEYQRPFDTVLVALGSDAAFTTLMLFQLFNVFNARSDEESAWLGLFGNRWLWGAVALSVTLRPRWTSVGDRMQTTSHERDL